MEQFVIELIGFVYINSCSISLTFPIAGNLNIRPSSCIKTPVYKNPSDGYRDSLPNGISNYRSDSYNKEKIHNLRYGYQIWFDKATHKYEGQFVQSDSILALPFGLLLRRYRKYNQDSQKI